MKAFALLLLVVSSVVMAQEQLTVRLNEGGLMNVMELALKYNTGVNGSKTLVVPSSLYKFTIKQKDLAANPIIQVVNDISNLNLNKNVDFYLHTSDIKVTGVVDKQSLSTTISNSKPDGFDIKVSINLSKITVNGTSMSLCEDKMPKYKKCGSGLKASISGLKITTLNRPVILTANMRVSVKKGKASVKVLSVASNLESKSPPTLDINFQGLTIPRIAIVINDQETELDTSRLKDEILERKAFLGKKLMAFAGDFIAEDLAEMINVYLKNASFSTTVQVYRREEPTALFDELDYEDRFPPIAVDNTYVRKPVIISPLVTKPGSLPKGPGPGDVLEEQIADIIRSAQVSLSLKSMSTPGNKDIQLAGVLSMMLNGQTINVQNRLGNKPATLPALNLAPFRTHDLNMAISEPVVNGALDLIGNTGLFSEIFEQIANVKGFTIGKVQIHFAKDKTLRAIVNSQIDLKKTDSNGFGGWLKKQLAAWLERNNNNAKIYFPIEVAIVPTLVTQKNGTIALSLFVKSPFTGSGLVNTFGYPSNVDNMTKTVKDGVMAELKKSLNSQVNKAYVLDITKFLNQSGVVFKPKSISFEQGAYMLINLDIADIKFNSKNPTKK